MIILLLWFVNFAISAFNAWACGKSWNETKHVGGFVHFMNWMGAVMSASGFTWCYLILLALLGSVIPIEQESGAAAPLLDAHMLEAVMSLGYLTIIGPIIGSGLALTIQSWSHFWRRRTFGSAAVAGWNTSAQVYNVYNAASLIPQSVGKVGSFFTSDDSDSGKGTIVLLLVVLALFGGVLTTYMILTKTARATLAVRHAAPTLF